MTSTRLESILVRKKLQQAAMPVGIPRSLNELTGMLFAAARLAVLVAAFVVLDRTLAAHAQLPIESYETTFLTWRFLSSLDVASYAIVAAILAGLALAKTHQLHWSAFAHGATLKWLSFVCAAALAGNFATSDRNFYVDQTFAIDRILLVLTAAAILYRPWLCLPFLLVVLPYRAQFLQPIGGYFPAETLPLVSIIAFICIRLALIPLLGRTHVVLDLMILAVCVQASCFAVPGLAKLKMGWLDNNASHLLPLHAYTRGWANWIDPGPWLQFAMELGRWDWASRIAVIVLEAGSIALLLHRHIACVWMLGWLLFVTGLACIIGYFFLYWAALSVDLLNLLRSRGSSQIEPSAPILPFGIPLGFMGIVLIGTSAYWLRPASLAWFDTPLCYHCEIQATTDDGQRVRLAPDFFRPYSDPFTMGGFDFLIDGPLLVSPYGITGSREAVDALRNATTENVLEVERSLGKNRYRESATEGFDDFLRRFINHYQASSARRGWYASLHPPPLLNVRPTDTIRDTGKRITSVDIVHVTTFFDDQAMHTIRRQIIRSVAIP